VRRKSTKDRLRPEYGTIPEASVVFNIGPKTLRKRAAEGCFPTYTGGTAWPRVKFVEVEAWLRQTRVPVSSHASQRVREVLKRESQTL